MPTASETTTIAWPTRKARTNRRRNTGRDASGRWSGLDTNTSQTLTRGPTNISLPYRAGSALTVRHHRVRQRADAVDRDRHHVPGQQREIVRRDDARPRQQDGA